MKQYSELHECNFVEVCLSGRLSLNQWFGDWVVGQENAEWKLSIWSDLCEASISPNDTWSQDQKDWIKKVGVRNFHRENLCDMVDTCMYFKYTMFDWTWDMLADYFTMK